MESYFLEGVHFDSGSFKDPDGRVFEYKGSVYRTLSPEYADFFAELFRNNELDAFFDRGLMIPCRIRNAEDVGIFARGLWPSRFFIMTAYPL